jgi:SAM-dependent methyltransferase
MRERTDLYDSHYSRAETDVYRAVRSETYGEDFGQTSWITAAECDEFCRWLGLRAGQRVLEVACGTGGTALRMAEQFGVHVTGVDLNASAIQAAQQRSRTSPARERVDLKVVDADGPLPFADATFDAVFCNDAVNHLRERERVLRDWCRVLRPGGRCLFTDPVVVTGHVTKAELEARSSIGFFLFVPHGSNEAFLRAAGLRGVLTADVTGSIERISRRWHDARASHSGALRALEGERGFDQLQHFLATVHTLSSQRRLSRIAYVGEKPAE